MMTRLRKRSYQVPHYNLFDILPEEVLYHLFQFISPDDIGHLAMTAKTTRNMVQTWIDSNACIYYLIPGDLETGTEREKLQMKVAACNRLAVLAKRTTFLYSTQNRIQLLNKWFYRLNCHLISGLSSDWKNVNSMIYFSTTLHTFSRGWDESEFPSLINQLELRYKFSKRLDAFLVGGNILNVEEESNLRLILRSFFWENTDENAKGAWLNELLHHKNGINYPQQAVLLYLILGPNRIGHVKDEWIDYNQFQREIMYRLFSPSDWSLPQEVTPLTFEEARIMFSDLGRCFQHLQKTSFGNSLIEVLTSMFKIVGPTSSVTPLTPFSWQTDNRAGLLLFTTELVVIEYIEKELELGKNDRVARLLVSMLVVCYRLENELKKSGLRKILDWTMVSVYPKEEFYTEFWQEIELRFEMGDLGEEMLAELGCHITAKAYNYDDNGFDQLMEE